MLEKNLDGEFVVEHAKYSKEGLKHAKFGSIKFPFYTYDSEIYS